MEELLKERYILMGERKAILKKIDGLQPPEGCMWTSLKMTTTLYAACSELHDIINKLDENKTSIKLKRKEKYHGRKR